MNATDFSVDALNQKNKVINTVMKITGAACIDIEESFSKVIERVLVGNIKLDESGISYFIKATYNSYRDDRLANKYLLVIDTNEISWEPVMFPDIDTDDSVDKILDNLVAAANLTDMEKSAVDWLREGALAVDVCGWDRARNKMETAAIKLGYIKPKERIRVNGQMRRNIWPDDDRFSKLYEKYSINELAKMFGCDPKTIYSRMAKIRNANGTELKNKKWTDSENDYLLTFSSQKMTPEKYEEIGNKLDRSWRSVKEQLRKLKKQLT